MGRLSEEKSVGQFISMAMHIFIKIIYVATVATVDQENFVAKYISCRLIFVKSKLTKRFLATKILNQTYTGQRFLKIDSVRIVGVRVHVCACGCVCPPSRQ